MARIFCSLEPMHFCFRGTASSHGPVHSDLSILLPREIILRSIPLQLLLYTCIQVNLPSPRLYAHFSYPTGDNSPLCSDIIDTYALRSCLWTLLSSFPSFLRSQAFSLRWTLSWRSLEVPFLRTSYNTDRSPFEEVCRCPYQQLQSPYLNLAATTRLSDPLLQLWPPHGWSVFRGYGCKYKGKDLYICVDHFFLKGFFSFFTFRILRGRHSSPLSFPLLSCALYLVWPVYPKKIFWPPGDVNGWAYSN